MNAERFLLRVSEFEKALARLLEASAQPQNDLVRDALIQRFEFTYELAWKAIKLWVEHKGLEATTAKEALQQGLQLGLIEDGNGWSELHKKRNMTSHIYDETMAEDVAAFVRVTGTGLFTALRGKFSALRAELETQA